MDNIADHNLTIKNFNIFQILKKYLIGSPCIVIIITIILFLSLFKYYYSYPHNIYLSAIIVNMLALFSIILHKIKEKYDTNMKIISNQIHNYITVLSEDNNSLAPALIHDIRNSIFVLLGYIYLKDYGEASKKIYALSDVIEKSKSKSYTGNFCVDKLIESKVKSMKKFNIKFTFINKLSTPLDLNNLDLCIIIGNTLDNAIEACCKIPDNKSRYIEFCIGSSNDCFNITISNSVNSTVSTNFKTTKPNKKLHGFGIKNIKSILKNYRGSFESNQDNNKFTVNIKLKSNTFVKR